MRKKQPSPAAPAGSEALVHADLSSSKRGVHSGKHIACLLAGPYAKQAGPVDQCHRTVWKQMRPAWMSLKTRATKTAKRQFHQALKTQFTACLKAVGLPLSSKQVAQLQTGCFSGKK